MGRRSREARRTKAQAAADRQSGEHATRLGRMLKDARMTRGLTQAVAAQAAGVSASTWSWLEIGGDSRVTLATLNRAATAVGSSLGIYLKQSSAATRPKDAVHLRHQELVIRTAAAGGWHALPEEQIDRDARTSRAADVLLCRRIEQEPACYALVEIWDWIEDVGAAVRDWGRRLEAVERYAIARMVGDEPVPRVSGVWVLRATRRNRALVAEHGGFFKTRFAGSSRTWLRSMVDMEVAMPEAPALVWVDVGGERLSPSRLG